MPRALRFLSSPLLLIFFVTLGISSLHALEKQPATTYHARRVALAAKLNGGAAILFAAEEPLLDFMPYRQDEDFYYLTGWNEPGAALLIVSESQGNASASIAPRKYREVLFLPTRNLRMEKYTGIKLDAATPGAAQTAGVDEVQPMTALPELLNEYVSKDRNLAYKLWTQPLAPQSQPVVSWLATTLGNGAAPATHDVTGLTAELRIIKDEGELALLKKAADASIAAQLTMMRATRPGVTERAIAGKILATLMENGCERPSYAPIVGTGINSTTLHYSENSATLKDGDIMVVDAAGEYSMYASDLTRTVPVNGHFTPRQREIYDVVLGAQRAAIAAFVADKSTINDPRHLDPNSLDTAAWNYINTHGKGLHGELLSDYWIHGLGHMVGINVHDPANYPAVLKPGMVFTIEPGVYIPEEKIGVRIEDTFVVGQDGKLIDLAANLPHTADEVEAAMKSK
ncbi:aminopeptidase P N-terminal domain-containing protein [Acidicapsa dinghuensis]|uniref:Xaa-Pro aminopeptidase n=1 Tax=Acidicapsa dinghuensis TaxID=2218256 RepID=A0ABW1EHW1_9BACT|nr:Xaa-Pro peptidase family protein [Acidicapsa dinghuensis]